MEQVVWIINLILASFILGMNFHDFLSKRKMVTYYDCEYGTIIVIRTEK